MIDDNNDFMAIMDRDAIRDAIDKFIVACHDEPSEDNLKALWFFLNMYYVMEEVEDVEGL
jgi:hypothetical protein